YSYMDIQALASLGHDLNSGRFLHQVVDGYASTWFDLNTG
ncbi:4974_t:CDS:1, partial [Dentiscutata erythropus]